ncbi:uncharacterized protein EV420DRAFT_175508 [Desarmillaria tabescens]|uniref:Uncharacterized protein n=1 Tax=Armillaria tabescens TaxID=1929756 RepID=A0AA39N8M2_ARMTA|nr:uncharacterized protein EV420DRAFT_175508 [Desarmillaria tabescens]KAK0461042.1 hypothetical protein EV420DRAFT_175508 [Desarmillaria tabescens]
MTLTEPLAFETRNRLKFVFPPHLLLVVLVHRLSLLACLFPVCFLSYLGRDPPRTDTNSRSYPLHPEMSAYIWLTSCFPTTIIFTPTTIHDPYVFHSLPSLSTHRNLLGYHPSMSRSSHRLCFMVRSPYRSPGWVRYKKTKANGLRGKQYSRFCSFLHDSNQAIRSLCIHIHLRSTRVYRDQIKHTTSNTVATCNRFFVLRQHACLIKEPSHVKLPCLHLCPAKPLRPGMEQKTCNHPLSLSGALSFSRQTGGILQKKSLARIQTRCLFPTGNRFL